MSDEQRVRKKRRKLRGYHVLILALLVGIGWFGLYRWRLKSQLQARIAAIRAAVYPAYPVTCAELDEWYSIPDGADNAAYVILRAISLYREPNNPELIPVVGKPVVGKAELPGRMEALSEEISKAVGEHLASNKKTLELLHEAAGIEHSRYPGDLGGRTKALTLYSHGIIHMARLLKVEAVMRTEDNQADQAVESAAAIFRISRSLSEEPVLDSQTAAFSCELTGVSAIERVVNRAELGDKGLAALSDLISKAEQRSDFWRGLVGERCIVLSVFRNPQYLDFFNIGIEPPHVATLQVQQALGLLDKGAIVYLDLMADYMETARLPEHERQEAAEAIEHRAKATWVSSISSTPSFVAGLITMDLRRIAQLRTTRAGLAIERYRLAGGKPPETLADLVPAYLDAVPRDPFDGAELRYKRLEKGYVVYSVGEDGSDDGGREFLPAHKRKQPLENWDVTFIVER